MSTPNQDRIGVLVVDDEPNIRTSLRQFLENRGYAAHAVESPREAHSLVRQGAVQVALIDLKMPSIDGIDLATQLLNVQPGLAVMIMTAHSSVETVVQAMKVGVYDYLTKPVEPQDLLGKLERVSAYARMRGTTQPGATSEDAYGFIGQSAPIRRVRELIAAAARSELPVLICGKTGTGKERVARAVHEASAVNGAFVPVNCTALPETLIESELFGHIRGAFTGAVRDRSGRIAAASEGTLFLDEIGAAPLSLQAKLLRVLQERRFSPVGSDKEETSKARIVAAMNQDPHELIAQGRLREDLFYRIGMFRIDLPALKDRREDLPLLIDEIIRQNIRRTGREPARCAPDLLIAFYAYDWPGNVRELENLLATMLALEPGPLLTSNALPPDYRQRFVSARPPSEAGDISSPLAQAVENFERSYVVEQLKKHDGRMQETAEVLGIDERSLRRKLRKWGVDRKTTRSGAQS